MNTSNNFTFGLMFKLPLQLSLDAMLDVPMWPTDRIRDHVKDGDEIFVTLTTKPKWTEACAVDFTLWQDMAYHNSPEAKQRVSERSGGLMHQRKHEQRMDKWRGVAWDSGIALRLQAVIGALPSLPAPPPPSVFGMAATSPERRSGPVAVLADALFENAGRIVISKHATSEAEGHLPAGATQWLVGGDMAAMFETDWGRMQSLPLLPTSKEREALKANLLRFYGPIRDVFRFYASVMNAAVGVRTSAPDRSAPGGGVHTVEKNGVDNPFKLSKLELDILFRCVSGVLACVRHHQHPSGRSIVCVCERRP